MGYKNKQFFRLWHGNKYDDAFNDFRYEQQYGLKYFQDSHPAIMKEKVNTSTLKIRINKKQIKWTFKNIRYLISDLIEKISGIRIGEHKNYRMISR